jgi:hypothetical protein
MPLFELRLSPRGVAAARVLEEVAPSAEPPKPLALDEAVVFAFADLPDFAAVACTLALSFGVLALALVETLSRFAVVLVLALLFGVPASTLDETLPRLAVVLVLALLFGVLALVPDEVLFRFAVVLVLALLFGVLALVLDEALFRFAATLLFCVPPLGPVTAVFGAGRARSGRGSAVYRGGLALGPGHGPHWPNCRR